ncbi:MAG TPA: glycosyltransferase family 39 protein [Caulobacteraceae bacterium]|nr:glycosyltransferase family 39 protein [Caulobacteraceae bacterium]
MSPARSIDPWRATLFLVGAFALLRLWALFSTPLELYPDEAQYWLWSRELAFGYYSKPPMIAWLIALTTGIGGDDEPWVRVSSLFLHAGAALALYGAGARLYGRWTGFWAAALYSLMPGVALSSGIASTDAPLLFFLSLALLAYAVLYTTDAPRTRLLAAAGMGAALGGAFLSKYAALYFLLGLLLHALFSRAARSRWNWRSALLAPAGFAAISAPNLIWNANHGFATVSHTAANADWNPNSLFNPAELLDFLVGQLGVFGPLPFLALLAGLVVATRRKALEDADLGLVCLLAPPLLLVSAQALLSRANANWAAAAYVPASVLVAAWLVRWNARRTLGATAAIQTAIMLVFTASVVWPGFADRAGLSNSIKRARGWSDTADRILDRAAAEPGLTALAVDDRFLFNALAYYGRDRLAGAPPLRMWVRAAAPQNQAEATAPLTPAQGARVLVIDTSADSLSEIAGDFSRVGPVENVAVPLDRKRTRDFTLFVAETYARAPRDPLTGFPKRP